MWTERAAVMFFLWVGCTAGAWGATGDLDKLQMILRLHSEADLHVPWLPAAQAITESIFEDTGIGMRWIDCHGEAVDPQCNRAPRANEFVLRLQRRRVDPASHACGVSLRSSRAEGHYITLYIDCIRAGSDAFNVGEPVLAAYTMAHEVGHLLLPVGHASSGIMRARPNRFDWERAKRGALRFQPSERRQIHDALRRRLASVR